MHVLQSTFISKTHPHEHTESTSDMSLKRAQLGEARALEQRAPPAVLRAQLRRGRLQAVDSLEHVAAARVTRGTIEHENTQVTTRLRSVPLPPPHELLRGRHRFP